MHPRKSYEFFCCANIKRACCKMFAALRAFVRISLFASFRLRSYAIHCLSISKSYEFVMTFASMPWSVQEFKTFVLQRWVAVLYNCSPRWFATLFVPDVVPKSEFKSKLPALKSKFNNPDKSKLIPLFVV